MAVLSTLQYIPTEVDTVTTHLAPSSTAHGQFNDNERNIVDPEMSNIFLAPATHHTHGSQFPVPHSGNGLMSTTSSSFVPENYVGHQHGGAPTDGEQVWYCSNCSNGPMSTWFMACACCGHQYCSYCKLEDVQ